MLWGFLQSSSDDDVFVALISSQLVRTATIYCRNGHTTLLLYHAVTLLLFCFLLQVLAPSGETFYLSIWSCSRSCNESLSVT
jgi:hypothetical protein